MIPPPFFSQGERKKLTDEDLQSSSFQLQWCSNRNKVMKQLKTNDFSRSSFGLFDTRTIYLSVLKFSISTIIQNNNDIIVMLLL